jgi:nucleoside-diphosphate-sugar epimerase
MLSLENRAIPPGSSVVVTGAIGFIASYVADKLLEAGYRVRGTVRSIHRAGWLQEFFDRRHSPDKFELIEVPKMEAPNAFDDAVEGASGIAHMATPVMQSFDPNKAVPMIVSGSLNALMAAAKETVRQTRCINLVLNRYCESVAQQRVSYRRKVVE